MEKGGGEKWGRGDKRSFFFKHRRRNVKAFVVVVRDLILVIINTYTFPSSTIDLSLLWKGGRFRAVATAPLSTCATITFGTARPIAVRSPLGRINMLLFARLVQRLMRLRHEDGQIERLF